MEQDIVDGVAGMDNGWIVLRNGRSIDAWTENNGQKSEEVEEVHRHCHHGGWRVNHVVGWHVPMIRGGVIVFLRRRNASNQILLS